VRRRAGNASRNSRLINGAEVRSAGGRGKKGTRARDGRGWEEGKCERASGDGSVMGFGNEIRWSSAATVIHHSTPPGSPAATPARVSLGL
jgi:hypothetical protein